MLVTNGFPKCGNHLLVKACELLGIPAQVWHIPYSDKLPENTTKHIFIKRDPRNLPLSYLRWKGKQITVGNYLSAYRSFISKHLVDELHEYKQWLNESDILIVSYEAMLKDSKEIKKIANYLEVEYISNAFECLPGYTKTWIDANHADYKTIWTPQIDAAWKAEGGLEIQTIFGY